MAGWIPGKAAEQLTAFEVFSREIAERPEAYGVSPDDAAEAIRVVAELDAAMSAASNPATRTPLTLEAKARSLKAAMSFFRPLATFIRANPKLSAADLKAIGLPPKAQKRRIPPPTTVPLLMIRQVIAGGHEIEIADAADPGRRGKPRDVRGLELFVAYSPHHGGHGEALSLDTIIKNGKVHSILARKVSAVIHPNDRVGSMANYAGRWINNRGEAGPFSQPVRMLLAMPGQSSLSEAA
jgi:hypothetical protein